MLHMMRKSTNIASRAIQAPCSNLVISTITRTRAVMPKPIVLMMRDLSMRSLTAGSLASFSSRPQCRIMPSWLIVNEMKTPTMYSWMSLVTSALNDRMSTRAPAARARTPLLNASRSPRVRSWRGK
ncbi:hypothetical protein D9M72_370980 [compost metagenome]